MKMPFFSISFFLFFFAAFSVSLQGQTIVVQNTCAGETVPLSLSDSTFNLVGDILWLVDGNEIARSETFSVEVGNLPIGIVEFAALWNEEVLDTLAMPIDTLERLDVQRVNIEDCPCEAGMPNVFLPVRNSLDTINGNINATFGPMFRAGCNDRFASIQLLIYSRWGNLVYDSCEGQPMPCTRLVRWDGTDNSGNPLPPDTYIYVAQYQIRSVSGGRSYEMERESGEVLLLR